MSKGQIWNAEKYDKNARFVSDLGMPVVELLAPKVGERILDLGCGDGALTEKLAQMGCAVVGVDGSPEFVEAAKKRGLDARVMKGQELSFENEFDAVFSNAALHWMKPPEAVIHGVRRALKAGGRFVAECGGKGNIDSIMQALDGALRNRGVDFSKINPWYYASDLEYRALLQADGFTVSEIALIPRPTPLPGDVVGWLETFAGDMAAAIPADQRRAFFEDVQERLKSQIFNAAEKRWVADYVRLRFRALKKNA